MQEFKTLSREEALDYAQDTLELIDEGSSRVAYILSSKKVLKIATNKEGIAQNNVEISIWNDQLTHNVITKIYEESPTGDWIIGELVRPINSWEEFNSAIRHVYNVDAEKGFLQRLMFNINYSIKAFSKNPEFCDFLIAIKRLIDKHDLIEVDLMKLDSWGITSDQHPVILDYGFTNEILSSRE